MLTIVFGINCSFFIVLICLLVIFLFIQGKTCEQKIRPVSEVLHARASPTGHMVNGLSRPVLDNMLEPENTYSCVLKKRDRNCNQYYLQLPLAFISQVWSQLLNCSSFNQPNRKEWGAMLVHALWNLLDQVLLLRNHHQQVGKTRTTKISPIHQFANLSK